MHRRPANTLFAATPSCLTGFAVLLRQRAISGALAALICLAAVLASPVLATEVALKKASLMPLWSPQAQFAGYYVALDRGIYAQHGIDLRIHRAGPGHSPADDLKDGKADFAVLWLTTAIQRRAAGTKFVNLAQMVQRSSLMLVARRSSGIRSVVEMDGHKVGLWGGDLSIPARALFRANGITVREVPQSQTVNLFLRGGIPVISAMWYNEYHTILMSGVDADELSVFSLHEQGMNFPEDGLYALESTIARDPALVDAFVQASLEGWRYAFAHPEEALDIVIRHMRDARVPANRVHQRWMLLRMRDLSVAKDPRLPLGSLDSADYRSVVNSLQKATLIDDAPDYRDFVRSIDATR